jgi:predicted secreted hydrolase
MKKHFINHEIYKSIHKIINRKRKETTVVIPNDDGFVNNIDVQWWYWTGHLSDENGEKFGFEVVFFAFDSWIFFKNILAQAAVTDIKNKKYLFTEEVSFLKLPKKIFSKFELISKKKNISATGGNGVDILKFQIDGYELELLLESDEEPVKHYNGKTHNYIFGGDTLYYSREKMKVKGAIKIDGKEHKVTGTSWFDRQYGELYQAIFKGWQWFAIELDNDTNIMIYDFLEKENISESFAEVLDLNGLKIFNSKEYKVKVTEKWKSPHTENIYPSGWEVEIDGKELIIKPVLKDQELRAKHLFWIGPEYWEGACFVYDKSGMEIGKAYVELNGFGNKLISIRTEGDDIGI